MKARVLIVSLAVLLLTTVAQAQKDDCRAHLFVINYNWDNPESQTPNHYSSEQLKWWYKDGQKKFKHICLTSNPKEADYLFSWTEKWRHVKGEIALPKTTVSQQSGTVTATSVGSGGVTNTNGTYSGTTTTTTTENTPYEYSVQHVGGYLYKIETIDGQRRPNEIPIFVTRHSGSMIWSKPDKDVLVDVLKHIEKQSQ